MVKKTDTQHPPLPFRNILGYGVGDYGMNLYWNSLQLLLLFYYTQVVGIEPKLAGTVFFIGTIWDAITDPVMATIAERTQTRWGQYRPFLLIGGGLLSLSFIILMLPIERSSLTIPFLIFTHLLFRTFYTTVSVPYSALSSKLTEDAGKRTILSGYRMFFAFLGFFSVSALAFPIIRMTGNGTDTSAVGFFWFACICAMVAFFCYSITFFSTSETPTASYQRPTLQKTLYDAARNLRGNRSILTMSVMLFFQSASNLVFLSMMAFLIQANSDVLRSKENILGVNALIMVAMIPVWTWIAHRFGKRRAWAAASTMMILAGTHLALFGLWLIDGFVVQLFFMACAQGAFGILVWSMIPDTIEYGAWKTGVRSDSAAFGTALFVQKSSIGLTGLTLGFLLDGIGYNASLKEFSDALANQVRLIVGLGPSILLSLAFVPLLAHPVSRATHATAVAALHREKTEKIQVE